MGGPVKQDLIFTGNILMGELNSDHLVNGSPGYVAPNGSTTTRIWGPIGFQFSEGESAATMYTNAVNTIPSALTLFAGNGVLAEAGYVPTGATRGSVEPFIAGGGSSAANTAWAVLSDQNKNMQ